MADTGERIEAFIRDVLADQGKTKARIRNNVRFYLAVCLQDFRDREVDERKKEEAAERCRLLCRYRVLQEISQCRETSTERHLRLALDVIEGPERGWHLPV
jgi:hypothetical protein